MSINPTPFQLFQVRMSNKRTERNRHKSTFNVGRVQIERLRSQDFEKRNVPLHDIGKRHAKST